MSGKGKAGSDTVQVRVVPARKDPVRVVDQTGKGKIERGEFRRGLRSEPGYASPARASPAPGPTAHVPEPAAQPDSMDKEFDTRMEEKAQDQVGLSPVDEEQETKDADE